jgi:hypothetical protein
MASSADALILQMQHLAAQAKASMRAAGLRKGLDRLKSASQRLAFEKQSEVDRLDAAIVGAEERVVELKKDGLSADETKEYLALKTLIDDAKKQLVKSRAQLHFALDRMEAAERTEYEAAHAEVRADTHGQLADDLSAEPPFATPAFKNPQKP